MRRLLFAAVTAAVAAVAASPGSANYTVQGKFLYRDRPQDQDGFTGNDVDKPVRFAKVQVVDDGNGTVLGTGTTTASGTFTIAVTESQVRDVYVRCVTDGTPGLMVNVRRATDNALFAVQTSVFTAHPPAQNLDFTSTPVVAAQTSTSATIGEAFNLFDQALDAFDFVASLNGTRPSRLLTLLWARNSSDGTYYSHSPDATIHLVGMSNDSDGFDDAVVLHEIGHYVEYNVADSDNPGGSHSLNLYYDLRLTWSEGWATFFSNMVRDWRGDPRPDLYVDTAGQPGTGQAFISYDVEAPAVGRPGANNEVTVNALLWDVVDTPSTRDATLGSDDDPLNLPSGNADFWDTFLQHIKFATSISLEDFWDGWFVRSHDHEADMRAVFQGRGVEYFPDAFENDNLVAAAKTVVAGSGQQHHTTYGAGDQDWFIIGVVGGSPYTFETTNLLSAADTRLDLYAANGTTLLASNDDRAGGDPSSRIQYTPPAAGLVYLKSTRHVDVHTYGSWDLVVTGTPVPVEISEVHVEPTPDGVWVRWRARVDGAFEHFEIERSPGSLGPWQVLGTVVPKATEGALRVYEYLDRAADGQRCYYRIIGVDSNGERQAFGPFAPEAAPSARLALQVPRPNPFNPTATVEFEMPRSGPAWLRVYAADGKLVRSLIAGDHLPAGVQHVLWDGRDDAGRNSPSGVYWLRLESGGETRSQRGVLVR